MSTDATPAASNWAEVLGRVPSGLYILTVRYHDRETGMLASWVMQAGFEPPSVTVAVRSDRYVAEWLTDDAPFVLNVVPEGDKTLLKHFGKGFEPEASAFEGLKIDRSPDGVPVLLDSLGHLECRGRGSVASGDHKIFLAEITGGALREALSPYVHIRKSGLRY